MMNHNHAREVKKFKEEWRRLLRLYRDLGMSYQDILVLYKFDKAVLNSDRRYYRHRSGLDLTDNDLDLSYVQEFDTYGIDNWVEVLPLALREKLTKLPEVQLRAFYLYRVCAYTQKEISAILNKPQRTISSWISKIAEIIRDHSKNC